MCEYASAKPANYVIMYYANMVLFALISESSRDLANVLGLPAMQDLHGVAEPRNLLDRVPYCIKVAYDSPICIQSITSDNVISKPKLSGSLIKEVPFASPSR